jgi:molybdopterin-binding protein
MHRFRHIIPYILLVIVLTIIIGGLNNTITTNTQHGKELAALVKQNDAEIKRLKAVELALVKQAIANCKATQTSWDANFFLILTVTTPFDYPPTDDAELLRAELAAIAGKQKQRTTLLKAAGPRPDCKIGESK